MTASAQQVEPEPEPRHVRVRATKSSDYADFVLYLSLTTSDHPEQVRLTLPAEAVVESEGPKPIFERHPALGLRPAVLLRRLAGDLALNGKPALGRWLQAAEACYGPMPEDGAVEMLQLWHVHWDLLDDDDRRAAGEELFEEYAREVGRDVAEARIAAALEEMTAEFPEDWEDEDEDDIEFEEGVDDED
jgi:hypothetical protein